MARMKRHPFLEVDLRSTVKMTPAENRKLKLWLTRASEAFRTLCRDGVIKGAVPAQTHFRVSLLICGNAMIRTLNQQHRGKDKVTDVLSFPGHEKLRQGLKPFHFEGGEVFLGDIAISWPQALRQSKQYNVGLWDEFIHLLFHGLLHLLEYDHEISAKEEKLMQGWEERGIEIFSKLKK